MKSSFLPIAVACAIFHFHCGSTIDTVQLRHSIELIKAWQLDYSVFVNENLAPASSSMARRGGQVERRISFVDFVSEALASKFNIRVTTDDCPNCGRVFVRSVESSDGMVKFFDISLYDTTNQQLTRSRVLFDTQAESRISTDMRVHVISFNRGLAAYVAEKIADLLVVSETP
jgi:hypothetical protein